MKKIIFTILALILLLPFVNAGTLLNVEFSISHEDDARLEKIYISEGEEFFENFVSEYSLQLLDNSDNVILSVPQRIYVPNPNHHIGFFGIKDKPIDKDEVSWVKFERNIEYDEDFHKLQIVKSGIVLLEEEIKPYLCNSNTICESFENHNSCSQDCKSGSKDNYCDNIDDGICDPDCSLLDKKDCGRELEEKPSTAGKPPPNKFQWQIAFVSMSAILIAVFLYFKVYKKYIGRAQNKVEKLKAFIKKESAKGHPEEKIREHLIKHNVPEKLADEAFNRINKPPKNLGR